MSLTFWAISEDIINLRLQSGVLSHPLLVLWPPHIPVEGPVIDRFGEMVGKNGSAAIEVGNRKGNLENSIIGPC
jgi:hypothetical protein